MSPNKEILNLKRDVIICQEALPDPASQGHFSSKLLECLMSINSVYYFLCKYPWLPWYVYVFLCIVSLFYRSCSNYLCFLHSTFLVPPSYSRHLPFDDWGGYNVRSCGRCVKLEKWSIQDIFMRQHLHLLTSLQILTQRYKLNLDSQPKVFSTFLQAPKLVIFPEDCPATILTNETPTCTYLFFLQGWGKPEPRLWARSFRSTENMKGAWVTSFWR